MSKRHFESLAAAVRDWRRVCPSVDEADVAQLVARLAGRRGTGELRYVCRRCGVVLAVVGSRLTSDALGALRDHVPRVHPDARLSPDADAGEVLRQYEVDPIP